MPNRGISQGCLFITTAITHDEVIVKLTNENGRFRT